MTREDRLGELIEALTRPAQDAPHREVPPEIVRAFATRAAANRANANQGSATVDPPGESSHPESSYPERSRARRRAGFATRTAVCALVVSGGAVTAAAAADDLPAPAQSVAHSMFGALGVPAPPRPSGTTPAGHTAHPKAAASPATSPGHVPPGRTHAPAVGNGQTKGTPASSANPSATAPGRGKALGHDKNGTP